MSQTITDKIATLELISSGKKVLRNEHLISGAITSLLVIIEILVFPTGWFPFITIMASMTLPIISFHKMFKLNTELMYINLEIIATLAEGVKLLDDEKKD
jgi:hypothetical protein